MIAEYNKQVKKRFNDLYCSPLHSREYNNRNSQSFEYYKSQEIAVKMEAVYNHTDKSNQADHYEPESKNQNHEKEGLYGRGLFHYGKWWEQSEVDIFVNGDILTGIPIFTDKNTLRVVNNCHSYFIPLEKVDYIRTTDGLHFCSGTD